MTTEINVLSRTQILVVEPISKSVSIINAGPQGPGGPTAQKLLAPPVYGVADQGPIVFETTVLETDSFTPASGNWVRVSGSMNLSFTAEESSPIGFGTLMVYVNDVIVETVPVLWFGPDPFLCHLDISATYQAVAEAQTVKLVLCIISNEILETLDPDAITVPDGMGLNVKVSSPIFGSQLRPELTVENLGSA